MTTNKSVAERIGLTHSSVSRIRSGTRYPSLAVMVKIEAETGWTVAEQMAARVGGTYAETFRAKVAGEPASAH